jgi:hypothetical protein
MIGVAIIGGLVAVVLLFHELSQIKYILCQIRDEAYFERTAHLLATVDPAGVPAKPQPRRIRV